MTFEEFWKNCKYDFCSQVGTTLDMDDFKEDIESAFKAGQENPNVKRDHIPTNADYIYLNETKSVIPDAIADEEQQEVYKKLKGCTASHKLKWISVNDRLPEKNCDCAVKIIESFSTHTEIESKGIREFSKKLDSFRCGIRCKVTHWIELPDDL